MKHKARWYGHNGYQLELGNALCLSLEPFGDDKCITAPSDIKYII